MKRELTQKMIDGLNPAERRTYDEKIRNGELEAAYNYVKHLYFDNAG